MPSSRCALPVASIKWPRKEIKGFVTAGSNPFLENGSEEGSEESSAPSHWAELGLDFGRAGDENGPRLEPA